MDNIIIIVIIIIIIIIIIINWLIQPCISGILKWSDWHWLILDVILEEEEEEEEETEEEVWLQSVRVSQTASALRKHACQSLLTRKRLGLNLDRRQWRALRKPTEETKFSWLGKLISVSPAQCKIWPQVIRWMTRFDDSDGYH